MMPLRKHLAACSKWRQTTRKPNFNENRRWGAYRLWVSTRMTPRAPNSGNFGPYLTLTGERLIREPAWSLLCNDCTLASPSLLELFGVHPAKSKAVPR